MNHYRIGFKLLTASLLFLLASTLRASSYSGYYTDPDDFYIQVIGMLDFDQERAARGAATPGLPGDGAMYCAPTAVMNLFAYLGMNGYPNLDPGDGNWDDESDDSAYNTITQAIDDLGDLMNTNALTGTSSSDQYAGIKEWLATRYSSSAPRNLLVAGQYLASTSTATTVARAAYLSRRGVVSMCYGFYTGAYSVSDPADTLGTGTLGTRNGGHCVSFSSGETLSARESALGVMDPDYVSAGDDLYSQSTMMERAWTTDDVDFTDKGWVCSAMQTLTSAGETRVIDEVDVIQPFWTLTYDPNLRLVVDWLSPLGSNDAREIIFRSAPVLDAVMRPDQMFAAVVTREPQSNLSQAQLLDLRTGETAPIVQGGTVRLAFSRFLELYVSNGPRIAQYDVEGGRAVELNATMLSQAPRGLEWVDEIDELWALDGERGRIIALPRNLKAQPRILQGDQTFSRLASDPMVRMTAVPGARVALLSPEQGVVALFGEDGSGLSVLARYDGALGAKDLSSTDEGHLLVAMANGSVVALAENGLDRLISTSSPTDGLRTEGLIEAARSHTNFDPRLHSGRGWRNGGPR